MSYKPFFMVALLIGSALTLSACLPGTETSENTNTNVVGENLEVDSEMAGTEVTMNIVETAQSAGQFSTLIQLVTQAGLANVLATEELTVFAPTDEAFAKLPAATLEAVQNDPELLAQVLQYHVVAGKVPGSDVVGLTTINTLSGETLTVTSGENLMINDASIISADIMATNGIIHVIDTVLVP